MAGIDSRFATSEDIEFIDASVRPSVRLMIAIFKTAINEAAYGFAGSDWLDVLDARDWLRYDGLEHLKTLGTLVPTPSPEQYRDVIRRLELEWSTIDDELENHLDSGPIPRDLAIVALVKARYISARAEGEKNRRLSALTRAVERRGVTNV